MQAVGKALRDARLRRGLTQTEAGARTGYSGSAISRIENGGPIELNTLLDLAKCYDVDLWQLGIGNVPPRPDPDSGGSDMHRRQFLAMAGLSVPVWALARLDESLTLMPDPPGPVSATAAADHLDRCRALYDKGRHTDLVTNLPDLLAAGHQHAESTGTPHSWATLASSYELATHILSNLGSHDSSRLTADRAVIYARHAESPVTIATATRALSIVLRHQQLADLAQRVNLDAITEIEKSGLNTPDERTMFVQMLCSTAYAAARSGDHDRASELTRDADQALRLLPPQPRCAATPVNATALTPKQVQLYKVSMHNALGDSAAALEAARTLHPTMFPTAERRARLFADLANAWWLHGRPDQSAKALTAAYRQIPGEVVNRPAIRTLATNLITSHPQTPDVHRLRSILTPD